MKQIISGREISMKVIYSILLIAITGCTTSSDNGCENYISLLEILQGRDSFSSRVSVSSHIL